MFIWHFRSLRHEVLEGLALFGCKMVGLCPGFHFRLGIASEVLEHRLAGLLDAVLFREVHHAGRVPFAEEVQQGVADIFVRVLVPDSLGKSFVDIEHHLAEGLCA